MFTSWTLIAFTLGALLGASGMGLFVMGVYVIRKLQRFERAYGSLYGDRLEDQRAREIRAVLDMTTGITYMRQALKVLSPEQAEEFYKSEKKTTTK